mmetsp:Transcript_1631/g.3498  ORF Transcript_1631/g.3498 Transcript_1631/m.3498 type:complete len:449 (-) Transcript_1631:54-1400(-)
MISLARRRSSPKAKEEEGGYAETEAGRASEARALYHECVEEIKNENTAIMGSLQLRIEAMKRFKQRQGEQALTKDEPMKTNDEPKKFRSTFARSLRVNELARSMRVTEITRSLHAMVHKSSSSISRGDSGDNLNEVMPGRRVSAFATGVDQDIITAQVLEDLELSEDESEDEEKAPLPGQKMGGNGGGDSRRPSFIRRTSALITRKGMQRLSRRRSSSVSSDHEIIAAQGLAELELCDDELEDEGGKLKDESPSPSNGEEMKPDKGKPSAIRKRSHARTGRRRSSLFSVEENMASTNGCSVKRSSFNSLGNSITEESLQGSFSGGQDPDGSLICNFGRTDSLRSSSGSIDSLICGWGRRQSMLSDSGVLSIQEELLDDGEKLASLPPTALNDRSNRSLLCDWNDSRSMFTNSSVSLHPSKPGDLKEEDEKVLLQAKKSGSLFDLRNEL